MFAYTAALNGHVKVLGEPSKFIGMEITRNRKAKTLTITQTKYIEKLAEKFSIGNNYKRWSGPNGSTEADVKHWNSLMTAKSDADNVRYHGKDYLGLIGSLLYAGNTTRIDIQYNCSYLAQFMQAPTIEAYEAAEAVLLYLIKTKSYGITYGGALNPPSIALRYESAPIDEPLWRANHGLHVLSDASWSVPYPFGGHVIMFGNGAVSWSSRKIKVVCDSSTEAEMAAASVGDKDLTFVRNFLKDADIMIKDTVPHVLDNSGAHDNIRNAGVTARTKHFERWVQYVRKLFRFGSISIHLAPDHTMMADFLTKVLGRGKHRDCTNYTMNRGD